MTTVEVFFWGFSGSIAVDVVAVAQFYDKQQIIIPERFKHIAFYVIRFLMAIIAGGLAVAYKIDEILLAVNIGAATPLLIQSLTKPPS
jgi:hypothetical protein